MAKKILQYPRFKVMQNLNGLYCLLKFDVLEKKYVEIPSQLWSTKEDAQAYANELNQEEEGFIEVEWDTD